MGKEIKILSPTAILGYGFPRSSWEKGLQAKPDLIAVDGGSVDPGPFYLGSGKSFTDRSGVKRDLRYMLNGAVELDIPLLIGTAGGAGADSHLEWCREIIAEIAREDGLKFDLAVIGAEISKKKVRDWYRQGKFQENGDLPINEEEIDKAERIVAQMGSEPFINALKEGAQVILAGRAYDPSVFAAYPIWKGYDPALALHLGKILECAAIASEPGSGRDAMLGILGEDYFQVEPLNSKRRCTPTSVAAHTLYEKKDPIHLPGPGGELNLEETTFKAIGERQVEVRGTRFVPTPSYFLKLEGAKKTGYRTISIAGVRDPIMIREMDNIIREVRAEVEDNFQGDIDPSRFHLLFRTYGKNGVMGDLEPAPFEGHELGLVIEAVAPTQAWADTLCSFARSTMLHYGYAGRISTAGNLAFPYSPSDFSGGAVYEFNIHHLVEIEDPAGQFPVKFSPGFEGRDPDA